MSWSQLYSKSCKVLVCMAEYLRKSHSQRKSFHEPNNAKTGQLRTGSWYSSQTSPSLKFLAQIKERLLNVKWVSGSMLHVWSQQWGPKVVQSRCGAVLLVTKLEICSKSMVFWSIMGITASSKDMLFHPDCNWLVYPLHCSKTMTQNTHLSSARTTWRRREEKEYSKWSLGLLSHQILTP